MPASIDAEVEGGTHALDSESGAVLPEEEPNPLDTGADEDWLSHHSTAGTVCGQEDVSLHAAVETLCHALICSVMIRLTF